MPPVSPGPTRLGRQATMFSRIAQGMFDLDKLRVFKVTLHNALLVLKCLLRLGFLLQRIFFFFWWRTPRWPLGIG